MSVRDWREHSAGWQTDYWLIGAIAVLMTLGLAMVASSSIAISEKRFGDDTHYFLRQLFSMGLGSWPPTSLFGCRCLFGENTVVNCLFWG